MSFIFPRRSPSFLFCLIACERFHTGRAFQFCDEQFLSRSTMTYLRDLVQQLTSTLKEVGITANQTYYQRNNGNMAMLMSLVGIGLYPDVAIRLKGQQVFTTEKGTNSLIITRSQLPVALVIFRLYPFHAATLQYHTTNHLYFLLN